MFNKFEASVDTDRHLTILGIIFKIIGIIGIFMSVVLAYALIRDLYLILGGGLVSPDAMKASISLAAIFLSFVAVNLFIFKFSKAITCKKWAYGVVGYIIGIILIFSFPIGTVIGVYMLWVLVQKQKQLST